MSDTFYDDRKAWDRLRKDLRMLGRSSVTIGVHDDVGTQQHGAEAVTVAEVAATHEFGADHIPERSFLRATFDQKEAAIRATVYDGINDVVQHRFTPQQVMDDVGMDVRAMVQDTMRAGINPPLSAQTIAAREAKAAHGGGLQSLAGQHTPLIDSGQLLASITHKVSGQDG